MDPAGSDQRIAVNRFTEWADLTRVGLGRYTFGKEKISLNFYSKWSL